MKFSGSDHPSISSAGDLVLSHVHFLKPLAYQLASDGKTRLPVDARYQLAKNGSGEPIVTFALG